MMSNIPPRAPQLAAIMSVPLVEEISDSETFPERPGYWVWTSATSGRTFEFDIFTSLPSLPSPALDWTAREASSRSQLTVAS
jgi:hypothetical protein